MSTDFQDRRVDIYNDGIGGVALIQHMGDDLTVVNAARASLDKVSTEWSEREERLSSFLVREGHTSTVENTMSSPFGSKSQCSSQDSR